MPLRWRLLTPVLPDNIVHLSNIVIMHRIATWKRTLILMLVLKVIALMMLRMHPISKPDIIWPELARTGHTPSSSRKVPI